MCTIKVKTNLNYAHKHLNSRCTKSVPFCTERLEKFKGYQTPRAEGYQTFTSEFL